jgi:LysR family glycine cleavage system transcriptional activator
MNGRLPPLPAIRAFEAAARLLSFTRAAEELAMTQAAVSYQVKVLEERVGSPLFTRYPRRVELTETGEILARSATEAFRVLGDGYEAARSTGLGTLSITTIPTFAANWLALHLGSFQMAHSGIAVRLDTSNRLVDLMSEDFDVGIRSATNGDWPGLVSHKFFPARFTPMLSPALAETVGPIARPEDLLKLPLLEASDPWWKMWFDAAGVDASSNLSARPSSDLGSQAYVGRAAVAGQGAAILTRDMFEAELSNGSLIQPFELTASDDYAYWLVYPEARRNVPKIKAFREWLLREVRESLGADAPAHGTTIVAR